MAVNRRCALLLVCFLDLLQRQVLPLAPLLLLEYLCSLDFDAVEVLQVGQLRYDQVHHLLFKEAHVQRNQPRQACQRLHHLLEL